eukprot:TRINITY_DN9444_c0_g3_i2.p1 TRINITY_DN9444_c0_g3~~TRINITY_DN9444_c0_g3_i2.p1  ORF type:complete len:456 (+),score=57.92 TRINITY_DN9444_c0_g3_i2:154-1368(+)
MELRVGIKYRLGRKIGQGSFGDVYQGTDVTTGETVAIKLEPVRARHPPQLEHEFRLYEVLNRGGNAVGIPSARWYGVEGDYKVMVVDLLGPSLEDLFNFQRRRFSLKTVLMLADQMLSRVEHLHSKLYLHRDLKPGNFLMGTGTHANRVYYGLPKTYIITKHREFQGRNGTAGTARYAGTNAHLGIEQSRRDDLESLGHILVYFLRGSLPRQSLEVEAPTKPSGPLTETEKLMEILNGNKAPVERLKKRVRFDLGDTWFGSTKTPVEVLCEGLPSEFAVYLSYARDLKLKLKLNFKAKPDYQYLRKLFRDLFVREGYQPDFVFDWTEPVPLTLSDSGPNLQQSPEATPPPPLSRPPQHEEAAQPEPRPSSGPPAAKRRRRSVGAASRKRGLAQALKGSVVAMAH